MDLVQLKWAIFKNGVRAIAYEMVGVVYAFALTEWLPKDMRVGNEPFIKFTAPVSEIQEWGNDVNFDYDQERKPVYGSRIDSTAIGYRLDITVTIDSDIHRFERIEWLDKPIHQYGWSAGNE